MNRMYRMSRKEYQGLLQVAGEQVPFKNLTRQFKARGFKVYM